MTIKAHCMGMEFPKRDTDSDSIFWLTSKVTPEEWAAWRAGVARLEPFCKDMTPEEILPSCIPPVTGCTPFATASMRPDNCWRTSLPSAADLDAVAEE